MWSWKKDNQMYERFYMERLKEASEEGEIYTDREREKATAEKEREKEKGG